MVTNKSYAMICESTYNWDAEIQAVFMAQKVPFEEFKNDQIERGRIIAEVVDVYDNPKLVGSPKFMVVSVLERMPLSYPFSSIDDCIYHAKQWYDEDPLRREVCVKKDLLDQYHTNAVEI